MQLFDKNLLGPTKGYGCLRFLPQAQKIREKLCFFQLNEDKLRDSKPAKQIFVEMGLYQMRAKYA